MSAVAGGGVRGDRMLAMTSAASFIPIDAAVVVALRVVGSYSSYSNRHCSLDVSLPALDHTCDYDDGGDAR